VWTARHAKAVSQAFASPDAIKAATGFVGALLTVAFAVSLTTALQRMYLRAWRRPPGRRPAEQGPRRDMGGRCVRPVDHTFGRALHPARLRRLGPHLAGGGDRHLALWWWTAHLMMLRGDVRWRALAPTAVVTGVGSSLYNVGVLGVDANVGLQRLRTVRHLRDRPVVAGLDDQRQQQREMMASHCLAGERGGE